MQVATVCRRPVLTIHGTEDVSRAAELMREKHVVVELDPLPHPVGVLTDRDIVVSVVARGVDPRGDVLRVVADDAQDVVDVIAHQRQVEGAARPCSRE